MFAPKWDLSAIWAVLGPMSLYRRLLVGAANHVPAAAIGKEAGKKVPGRKRSGR